jgi:shikimate dehydrogenase
MIKQLGLIGFPLSHSFSVSYFKSKFEKENITDFTYQNFEIPKIEDLKGIIDQTPDLIGLNVTIPYKEQVIPFLDELDEDAKKIGAVNTIKIERSSKGIKLIGYNTDCYGFKESLKPLLKQSHYKALILGTGGAAKAVEFVLKEIGLDVLYVSRNPSSNKELSYEDLVGDVFSKYKVIINSTPLGMFPKVDNCPDIPYHLLNEDNLLYDLVYNPSETLFMKKGAEKSAATQNGLPMLQLQAERAWQIWNNI